MHRLLLPLGFFLCTVFAVTWQSSPQAAQSRADSTVAHRVNLEVVGVGSCAAASCHHGNDVPGTKGSEYSTWVAQDPHAKAYSALFKPESQRMHEILSNGDEAARKKGAHRNVLCLKCHGAGDGVPEALQADGVGCERCHGPAQQWKSTHYLPGFTGTEPGFRDLGKLPLRVESCMNCHVGSGNMEVDHDLIAAGHPRLRFEYASYYASYPRHWDDSKRSRPTSTERPPPGDDLEIRSWLLGQVIAARAAAELLAHRANNKPDGWPEFAEHDCAACHHQLEPRNFRTDRDLALLKPGVPVALGRIPWGTWYYPLLPTLSSATNSDSAARINSCLKTINEHMHKRLPPAAKVGAEATQLAHQLRQWEAKIATRAFKVDEVKRLIQIVAREQATVQSGWDGGAEVYLALAALHHGWTDLDAQFKQKSQLRNPLVAMRNTLVSAYPQGASARPRYDVPAKYNPAALLASLKQLSEVAK